MKIKKIYTKHFPPKGFKALTFYPVVFVRKDCATKFNDESERHETTHALQQIELLWILFFLLYVLEWLIKIPFCGFDCKLAYKSISFEQEAYEHMAEIYYNDVRKHYAWIKYVFTLKK